MLFRSGAPLHKTAPASERSTPINNHVPLSNNSSASYSMDENVDNTPATPHSMDTGGAQAGIHNEDPVRASRLEISQSSMHELPAAVAPPKEAVMSPPHAQRMKDGAGDHPLVAALRGPSSAVPIAAPVAAWGAPMLATATDSEQTRRARILLQEVLKDPAHMASLSALLSKNKAHQAFLTAAREAKPPVVLAKGSPTQTGATVIALQPS